MRMDDRLEARIDLGMEFLLREADRQFAEVTHNMLFPFAAGFSGPSEHQSSDVFGRAVLGGLLLDIAGLVADDLRAQLESVAAREADHVARSKLRDRAGGWSYFPDLPNSRRISIVSPPRCCCSPALVLSTYISATSPFHWL